NATFMGGRAAEYGPDASGRLSQQVAGALGQSWLVRRLTDATNPSRLVVFTSATSDELFYGVRLDGFFRIDSPWFTARRWQASPPSVETPPGRVGSVSFRFAGRAVGAHLD